jgi:hypothetical protein
MQNESLAACKARTINRIIELGEYLGLVYDESALYLERLLALDILLSELIDEAYCQARARESAEMLNRYK